MQIHWKRVIVAGVVMELVYFAYVFLILGSGAAASTMAGLIGVFLIIFPGGLWSVWNAKSASLLSGLLNGALVGFVAVAFYSLFVIVVTIINGGEIQVPGFGLNHSLKVLGGAAGGFIATAGLFQNKVT